jgi:hypothetical protein
MSTHYISSKDISLHELFDGRLAVTRTRGLRSFLIGERSLFTSDYYILKRNDDD